MNKKRIFFFASFGDFKLPPSGGGQNAARRLLNTLKKLGYDVPLYSRHRPDDLTPIKNRLIFLLAFIVDPIVYFLSYYVIGTIQEHLYICAIVAL